MAKYDYHLKLKIVKENELGYGYKYLSKKYNISRNTIQNWCQQYTDQGEESLKKSLSKTNYSGEFKLTVLTYRHTNKLSYRQTAEHFNIKNPSTIANWQRKYNEEGFEGLTGNVGRPSKSGDKNMSKETKKPKALTESEREELIRLREENQYLKAAIAYEKKLQALIRKKELKTKKRQK